MKKLTLAALLAATLATGTMTASMPAAAQGFAFSFNTGDVAFAYNDGYWDHGHNWHAWRNAREAREFRRAHAHLYNDMRHTRVRNQGWRDSDHDGIPNRYDNHPENPRRP